MKKVLKLEKLEFNPTPPNRKRSNRNSNCGQRENKNREAGYIALFFWAIVSPLTMVFTNFTNPLAWVALIGYGVIFITTYQIHITSESDFAYKLFRFVTWLIIICGPGLVCGISTI